jgi:hypothetical protein
MSNLISDAALMSNRLELGKLIEHDGDNITIKRAIERGLIIEKSMARIEKKNGDTKIERWIKLDDGGYYSITRKLWDNINLPDSTSAETNRFIDKYADGISAGGVLKYDDYMKINKR